ncbi:unnamed protein product, partial [Medioppia subpectinata]
MGTIIAVPLILGINKFIKLCNEINWQLFKYFNVLIQLLWQRRGQKSNRIVRHDVWNDSIRDAGILPFPHEWDYDLPSQAKCEDLLIYGVNSSKQSIYIAIKWRPKGVNDKINATISLRFDDNNSNSYTLEEDSEVEYRSNEYRVCGLGLEISSPFRRKRIKFRGYLTKNGKQLVYFTLSPKYVKQNNAFEDRFQQFGQMKGTFKEDKEEERQIYFWGSISKKYAISSEPLNRKITRICGYTKKGIGFELGFVENSKLKNSFAQNLSVNGFEGMCYVLEENETQISEPNKTYKSVKNDLSLVLGFNELNAKRVDLSGGKGSSLAVL